MSSMRIPVEIYSLSSIEQAIDAYRNLARIEWHRERENFICLDFSDCKFDENRTMKEFENYLISIENL